MSRALSPSAARTYLTDDSELTGRRYLELTPAVDGSWCLGISVGGTDPVAAISVSRAGAAGSRPGLLRGLADVYRALRERPVSPAADAIAARLAIDGELAAFPWDWCAHDRGPGARRDLCRFCVLEFIRLRDARGVGR